MRTVTEVSKFRFEPLELSPKEESRKKKKTEKKRKSGTIMTAFEFTLTNEEPAAEQAAAEEYLPPLGSVGDSPQTAVELDRSVFLLFPTPTR
ncbi:hypothetical protein N7463_001557 [Penicillium fimorum]|uniref:Uncharacterized protein n=1 Tax=Penicillium fimorum TaxID=1882269 RepID=A0A9W9Y6K4_9EURO|nr:hypothetical protein N7463_001557 [Penicillium fimorum]